MTAARMRCEWCGREARRPGAFEAWLRGWYVEEVWVDAPVFLCALYDGTGGSIAAGGCVRVVDAERCIEGELKLAELDGRWRSGEGT